MLNRKRAERTPANPDTSLIARGTLIRGDVRFSGTLHLDGRIEGSVHAEDDGAVFTLSEHGLVQGEIRVPHAIINGHVQGDIHVTDRLELAPEARITGDVHYRSLEMAAGAQVNGRMSHHAAELPRELPAPSLVAEPVPA
ncbi:polymer-forming cytoskeletal protein [Dyella sp. C9]|uniref:bactofilin family protein n=1 Tax=Dyella sp. C9 TaxID=2202154 RepID=UPI000DEEC6DA|nr:polymer-forming cytoskeletal protein [Dyella sp. C9]